MPEPIAWPTTPWSTLLDHGQLSGEARRRSLNDLLLRYWPPIQQYFARAAPPETTDDWSQEFVTKFLEQDLPRKIHPDRISRFRCYLAVCLRNFRASRTRALPERRDIALDEVTLEVPVGEFVFHKAWARQTVEHTLAALRMQAAVDSRAGIRLECFIRRYGLDPYDAPAANAEIAAALSLTVRQVEERLREARVWFRDCARAEVRLLVASDLWVDSELVALAEALRAEDPDL